MLNLNRKEFVVACKIAYGMLKNTQMLLIDGKYCGVQCDLRPNNFMVCKHKV